MTTAPEPTMEPPEPTPVPEGESLDALDEGQEITADDRRYAIRVPEYWVRKTAPPADIAVRESGGTPAHDGYAYSVSREALPTSIKDVEAYADYRAEQLGDGTGDVEMLSVEPVQLAGLQGIRALYTLTGSEEDVLVHTVYLVDDESGFVLTGRAPLDGDTDAASDLFDKIAGSLSFPRG